MCMGGCLPNGGTGAAIARVANSSISENLGVGLDNFSSSATFESLGNNSVRGNVGGNTAGTNHGRLAEVERNRSRKRDHLLFAAVSGLDEERAGGFPPRRAAIGICFHSKQGGSMCHSRTATCLRAILVLVLIGFASSMGALANRVFVSARSGNDANSCDNINTPCQTFAGAVVQLNPGGEAIVLDSGGYGPVTITQSVTIEAPPGVTAFVHPPSGDAITISAGPIDTVVLRGLILNVGTGRGIVANTVGTLHIESCVVSGFAGTGIYVAAPNSKTFIKDTISRQNGSGGGLAGIAIVAGKGSIDHCHSEGNKSVGFWADNGDVTIRDSVAAGNGDHGFLVMSGGSESSVLAVYDSVSTNNGGDGFFANKLGTGPVTARVANSSISENSGAGLDAFAGSTFESLGNNLVRGNAGGNVMGVITIVPGQ